MVGQQGYVVVVGGANMDLKARSLAPLRPGTSNPGTMTLSPGGVGRNVAENLARLGSRVLLVAAVGSDGLGDDLLAASAEAGVDITSVLRRGVTTGTYTAVLDSGGELSVAVADMTATDSITPADIEATAGVLGGATLVVVDANLSTGALSALLRVCADRAVPVVADPVSTPKAPRLTEALSPARPVLAITPNAGELSALTGFPSTDPGQRAKAVAALYQQGAEHVWVRLGPAGSELHSRGAAPVPLPALPGEVVDVTGAGDAMLGAFCHALLEGRPPEEAAEYGQAAAALTVAVPETVRRDLRPALIDALLERNR